MFDDEFHPLATGQLGQWSDTRATTQHNTEHKASAAEQVRAPDWHLGHVTINALKSNVAMQLLLVLGLVLVDLEVAERVGVLGGSDDTATKSAELQPNGSLIRTGGSSRTSSS